MSDRSNADVSTIPQTRRLRREYRTIQSMFRIWCADHHPDRSAATGLCMECESLLAYAGQRLVKCPYGEDKPTCNHCPVHCYKRAQREQVRKVMRYAGPRMPLRHPWQALLHVFDKLRRVEHPRVWRRRGRGKQ